ncbi:IMP cyclohydrolase [Chloroflexota bacterium]
MKNPNGPYPGRQLFLGSTKSEKPAFAYLVTGRSPASRERKATPVENGIIMGPIGNEPYDWLRHYTAVKYDNDIGLMTVSNGIQTEAIFEMYRLLHHTGAEANKHYIYRIMEGANYEPDSLHTPRIAGVISGELYILSIVADAPLSRAYSITPEAGTLTGIATYAGDMENPVAFDLEAILPVIDLKAETPEDIAAYIYEISEATNKGDDIRVCAIGGVRSDNTWKLATINRHK